MSEKCNEGCMIQTRIGKKNGDRFDEIERGCIPKLEHTVGCDTDSKDVSTIVYETHLKNISLRPREDYVSPVSLPANHRYKFVQSSNW